jgi:tellurite resistance protein
VNVVRPTGFEDTAAGELLAMLEVMYLVATADGYFSADERREFLAMAESLSDGKLQPAMLRSLVDSWSAHGGTGELGTRLGELAASLPDETSRRIAYGLAVQMAESDGQYLDAEAHVLAKLAAAFGLDDGAEEDIAVSVRMSRRPKSEE